MSDVSGGVCSTASAAIVCVTVLLENYPKSEAFFNGSRQHFPPSLSRMLTLRTFNYSESSRCTDSSYFKTPSLSEFETLRAFRLRIFGGCRLFVY